jgi:hypothetical protein
MRLEAVEKALRGGNMTDQKADTNSTCGMYKGWPVYASLPEGWKIDCTAGSPLAGHSFATDCKSIIKGGKRALVKIEKTNQPPEVYPEIVHTTAQKHTPPSTQDRRAINDLARAKFKEQLLKDLTCDLMVCKIEQWGPCEYIAELHALIDGLNESISPKQKELFARTTKSKT